MIQHMFRTANKGIAFNLLDDRYFSPHPLLKAHNRKRILQYCDKLNAKVKAIDGYLEDDFTIVINK